MTGGVAYSELLFFFFYVTFDDYEENSVESLGPLAFCRRIIIVVVVAVTAVVKKRAPRVSTILRKGPFRGKSLKKRKTVSFLLRHKNDDCA